MPDKLVPQSLGPLPVDAIYNATGHELDPGEVLLSVNAQKHARKRHPDEYDGCLPHLKKAIAAPNFIGDDHRNPDKIELLARAAALPGGDVVLVAVNLERDSKGRYHIASFYPITEKNLQTRLEKGFLKRAIP